MLNSTNDKLTIHVNIEISSAALQAIVANAKRMAAKDADGICRVDTADQVSFMVSRFLDERDFDNYVLDLSKYTEICK
jgi:ribosome maturation factor RimP